jgi:hypothetical protein
MNRSIPIPLVTIGLGLTQGCATDVVDPNGPNGDDGDVDPLVGDWTAVRVADEDYPFHDEYTYNGYYGSWSSTVDRSAELSVYADLSGYFDVFVHVTQSYGGGEPTEYNHSSFMTVNVPSAEGSNYSIVLRTDGEVSKLDCTLEEPALTCMDQFEKAWDFERQ